MTFPIVRPLVLAFLEANMTLVGPVLTRLVTRLWDLLMACCVR